MHPLLRLILCCSWLPLAAIVTTSRTAVKPGSSVQLLEISDDVCARLRVVDPEEHLGAGNQRTGVGQPAVERCLVPGQAGILQSCGVGIILNASCTSPDDTAMPGSQIIVIDGVTS